MRSFVSGVEVIIQTFEIWRLLNLFCCKAQICSFVGGIVGSSLSQKFMDFVYIERHLYIGFLIL